MHPAEHNHITGGFLCLARQSQRITHKISDILNFRALVTVRQNDGIAFFLETENLLC